MTPDTNIADKMKSVKAELAKAPTGPKKDAAQKLYQAAVQSQSANQDAAANKSLDQAKITLSWQASS